MRTNANTIMWMYDGGNKTESKEGSQIQIQTQYQYKQIQGKIQKQPCGRMVGARNQRRERSQGQIQIQFKYKYNNVDV